AAPDHYAPRPAGEPRALAHRSSGGRLGTVSRLLPLAPVRRALAVPAGLSPPPALSGTKSVSFEGAVGRTSMSDELVNLLMRLPSAIAMRARVAWLRCLGARIGRRCWIQDIQLPRNPWDVELAER